MLMVGMRYGMIDFIKIFASKMEDMGISIKWHNDMQYVYIEAQNGVTHILSQALEYCYEETYAFTHKGLGIIQGKMERTKQNTTVEIKHMYIKWCRTIKRCNSF